MNEEQKLITQLTAEVKSLSLENDKLHKALQKMTEEMNKWRDMANNSNSAPPFAFADMNLVQMKSDLSVASFSNCDKQLKFLYPKSKRWVEGVAYYDSKTSTFHIV